MTCFLRNIFLGIFFLFFLLPSAHATHIIGGEMSYTCLGNDLYEISLTVYRDCDLGEALLDDTAYVAVYDLQGLLVTTVPILLNGIDTVTQAEDCLLAPENLCIETTTYRDTVLLTPKAGGYHIAYQRCCRNATILNIIDPLNTGTTYDIVLTEAAMLACNTSPKIKAWPPTYICVNRPLLFDHSATDNEGDSLAYKLCTPLDGGISLINPRPRPAFPPPYDSIQWQNPTYSLENLLGGEALTIDPSTGILTGTPATIGQFVVGVCVEEYRNGIMISETRRDFQYNVIPCQDIAANFDAPLIPCDNFNITLNNTSVGASDYFWKFLDGDRVLGTSKAINPSFLFPQEGNYTIRLIVDQGTTCVDSMDQEINLNLEAQPTDFSFDIEGCQDSLLLQLKDLSSQNGIIPIDWRWTIKGEIDQFVSTESNPSFLIKNTQSFDLSLIVKTENGCFLEAQKQTQVVVLEDAASTGPPDTINTCGNTLVALNPDFDPSLMYDWSFHPELPDPTLPNPIITIDSPTKYTVRISDSTGICQFNKVVVIDTAAFVSTLRIEKEISCDGQTVRFQANQKAILAWDFGDGESIITRNNAPVEHTYNQINNFEVVITDITPGRCKEEIILPINTAPIISPNFNWKGDNCSASSIDLTFENLSTIPQEGEVAWLWELGDGQRSTLQHPSFTLKENVSTDVSLTVTTNDNLNCTATKTVSIPPLLIDEPRLQTISACTGNIVALNPDPNPQLQYDWSANEGISNSTAPNPSVLVNAPTSYLVRISDSIGVCQFDRIVAVDTTTSAPINVRTISDCDGKSITFIAEETGQYIWDFGDGTPSIEQEGTTIVHTYNELNDYEVVITDMTPGRCNEQIILPINTAPIISLNFSWEGDNCTASSIDLTFNDQSIISQEGEVTWLWELGDGQTSTLQHPNFTLTENEAIDVSLTITSNNNRTCTATKTVSIPPLLIDEPRLQTISPCAENIIALNPNYNPKLQYDWSANEGISNPTAPNPSVAVNGPSSYLVRISDSTGVCQFDKTIVIDTTSNAPINVRTIADCDGKGITFITEEAGQYIWDFGDGTPSIEQEGTTIEHTFDNFGDYQVNLQYIPDNGCAGTTTIPVSIVSGIEANFDWSGENCSDTAIELVLEDLTKTTQGPIDNWLWELSDGRTATTPNPIFEIKNQDPIRVTLTVSSSTMPNCNASTTLDIPTLLLDTSQLQDTIKGCIGQVVALNPNPTADYNYDWSANEGIDLSDPINPLIAIDENKSYTASISNEFGCEATKIIEIETAPTIEVEASQNLYFCEPTLQTEIFAYSDQAQQQWWLNELGDTIGTEPELVLSLSKTEQFTSIIQDEYGCTLEQHIIISNEPIDLSFAPMLQICQLDTIQLEVINRTIDRALSFSWSPNETILSGINTNTPVVSPSTSTTYEFIATDEFGCELKGNIPVSIEPIELDITIDSESTLIYSGSSVTLSATENPNYTYNWTPTNSMDNATISNPTISPTENTLYQLTITNEIGCTATASINVEVETGRCEEPFIFLPNAFTPDGDGQNDILYLRGAIIHEMELVIYDRWGDEIFTSFSPDIGWDGTYKGKAQPSGVFGYYIYVECINGEEFYKQGNVSLIR